MILPKIQYEHKEPQLYLTAMEVSLLLDCNIRLLYQWCKVNRITTYRVGKISIFKKSEIDGKIKSFGNRKNNNNEHTQ